MNDLKLIKKEIVNRDLLIPLLESMGCESVAKKDNYVQGTRPDGDNPKGFLVYIDDYELKSVVQTRKIPTTDIYDLVSYFKFNITERERMKKNTAKAKSYIIDTLKLNKFKSNSYKDVPDYNFFLRDLQKKRQQRQKFTPNNVLSDDVMKEFVRFPHQKWIDDNIDWLVQDEFEVCFDIASERICFPVRNSKGELVGVRGRATKPDDDAKYLPIYTFQKSKELFNLHRAKHHIIQKGEVLIFESEKSCMKCYQNGILNTVSLMGSDFSEQQVNLLFKIIPDGKLILCPDKDKSKSEIKDMMKNCKGKFKKVYSIWDKDDLLEYIPNKKADSPIDKGSDIFHKLYKNCVFPIKL